MAQHYEDPTVRSKSPKYRITACGRAVAEWEQQDARSRHLVDLLRLLHTAGQGLPEAQLRQFMPLESLLRAVTCLVAMGLIESDGAS